LNLQPSKVLARFEIPENYQPAQIGTTFIFQPSTFKGADALWKFLIIIGLLK
jgi:hypothetical protein